jgi:putative SOS response-associated peptidase YedK
LPRAGTPAIVRRCWIVPCSAGPWRCLLPTDGFFEWQVRPDRPGKQPQYIRLKDGGLFAFAGLYTSRNGEDGTAGGCAIITTAPNDLMAPIYDHMPAILDPSEEVRWLNPTLTAPDAVLGCLRPYPAEDLVAYPVSPAVSKPRNDGAQLIAPLA